jgi:hypothetical protein
MENNLEEINKLIEKECDSLKKMLIQKNIDYNNSLHNPIRIFSKCSNLQGILCRLDDKLSRISKKGIDDKTEDSIGDLIGYLVHLKISLGNDKDN